MGGGGSKQKSSVENRIKVMNQIITNVVINATKSCSGAATQEQILKVKAAGDIVIGGDVSMQQMVALNVSCLQSNQIQANVINDIANKLTQFAKAAAEDASPLPDLPWGGKSESEVKNIVNLSNQISNNIGINMKSTCSAMLAQSQNAIFESGGSFIVEETGKIGMTQSAELLLKCIQTDDATVKLANKLANAVGQEGEAKVTETIPLMPSPGLFGDLFGGLGDWLLYGAIGVAVVIALIVLLILVLVFLK